MFEIDLGTIPDEKSARIRDRKKACGAGRENGDVRSGWIKHEIPPIAEGCRVATNIRKNFGLRDSRNSRNSRDSRARGHNLSPSSFIFINVKMAAALLSLR
jgi:hypothetical protein